MAIERPDRKRIRLDPAAYRQNHPFSITLSTYKKHPWFQIYPEIADELVVIIKQLSDVRVTNLYAWCIMPDHVHLLLQDKDIVAFVRLIKGKLTSLGRRLEPGRKLWQRSFYDHAIRAEEKMIDVANYIFENPVRAGLAEVPADYPWSGSLVWPNWRHKQHQL